MKIPSAVPAAIPPASSADNGQRFQELERLVSLSLARFVDLPVDRVEHDITATLRLMVEFCGFDRCALMAIAPEKERGGARHSWEGAGTEAAPGSWDLGENFPWTRGHLLRGEIVCISRLGELPPEASLDRQNYQSMGVKSCLAIPLRLEGGIEYFIAAQQLRCSRSWREESIMLLCQAGEIFLHALERCRRERELEPRYAQAEMICSQRHEQIIGQSAPLTAALLLAEKVALTDSTVLISGETGTGKELVAHVIHQLGPRRNKPMVKVNCASLPAALVESELFGREKGAYTGALTRQAGRFEVADGGTIFLDEIAEMSLELQAKLLRVLQEGEFERLGSTRTVRVDVRVIAATNRDLAEEVKKGRFREDLYYRVNVFQIVVPPLRERIEDIPLLVWAFVNEFGEKMGKKINRISKEEMTALQRYSWPGNVRELRNVIEHAVIVGTGDRLQVRLPENARGETPGILTLAECEARHIREVLRLTKWRIKGEGGAAQLLGLNPSTLYSRMQKAGIPNRQSRDEISP